jgi:hypothetical protein
MRPRRLGRRRSRWIERKGFAKKGMNAIASAEIGGFVGDGRGDRTFRQRHTEADG